ncbi:MAG: hypothetical protein I3274_05895 [Candidatus Moeniiplasma glomeromycotorum]|nr:hypothetical protein [Candidatus Moeniiplasma glomeromycotorum]
MNRKNNNKQGTIQTKKELANDNKKKEIIEATLVIKQKRESEILQLAEKIERIIESNKDTYKRKLALFNLVKNLEIGESQSLKEQRINHLLQCRLYNELAKKSMKEYKKTTMEAFSKTE